MILEGTIYCDGPDCNANTHVGQDTMAAGRLPMGFVKTIEYSSGNGDGILAFCCWDCVLKYAGRIEPPTIIPFTPLEDTDA